MRIRAILFAFLTCTLAGAQDNTQMSPAARAYLEEALNYMQQSALNKKSINWPALRLQTFACCSILPRPLNAIVLRRQRCCRR